MKTIYFDHAATTAVAPEVKEAMEPYFCENYGKMLHHYMSLGINPRKQ